MNSESPRSGEVIEVDLQYDLSRDDVTVPVHNTLNERAVEVDEDAVLISIFILPTGLECNMVYRLTAFDSMF